MLRQFIGTRLGALAVVGTAKHIAANGIFAATVVMAAASFGQPVFADWIDTKTGKHVTHFPIAPGSGTYKLGSNHVVLPNIGDPTRAFDPETGRNFALNACGDWIDTKTGKRVTSFPIAPGSGTYKLGSNHVVLPNIGDPKRAFDPETGRNFAREACPPQTAAAPQATPQVGMLPFQPFIGIEGGIGGSNTNFNVSPPFSVSGTGGVFGINGGVLFPIAGTPFAVGPQLGWLGGNMGGTTDRPAASPTFSYLVKSTSTFIAEAKADVDFSVWLVGSRTQWNIDSSTYIGVDVAYQSLMRSHVTASFGMATVDTNVTGTSGGSTFSDSTTRTGVTASIGVQVPVAPQVAATAQFRWINVPSGTVNIPGAVQVDGNRYIGTVGLTWYPWAPTAPAR